MLDKLTGKSRGFGFVTFRNADLVHKVLSETHYIDGKKVFWILQRLLHSTC